MSRFSELRCKEVINVKNGVKLGFVEDVDFDSSSGKISSISIPGPAKLLGIFARDEDYIINWENIDKIGDDIILVTYDMPLRSIAQKQSGFSRFWSSFFK